MDNATVTPEEDITDWRHIGPYLEAVVLFIVVAFIVSGNIICLIVVQMSSALNEISRVFMTSLSMSDLMAGTLYGSFTIGAAALGRWPYGHEFCSLSAIITVLATSVSMMSLLAMNLERYIAIVYPYVYIQHMTIKKSRINVLVIWSGSLGWALLYGLLPGREAAYHSGFHTCFYNPIDHHQVDIPGLLTVICFICVSFITTLVLYSILFRIARKHMRAITAQQSANTNPPHGRQFRKSDAKAAVTFFVVTMAYALAWLPFVCCYFYETFTGKITPDVIASLTQLLALSNSWWNIVIYYARNTEFRKQARKIMCCFDSNGSTEAAATRITTNRSATPGI
ncbi:beta-1 adrenergic receptor-like [Amphiura filiformis]|uniref:beta-1 adrenergic receptor-like n=1 Tax=Amphiura filiformis TaxID=82378 RepID=UPI003B21B4CA